MLKPVSYEKEFKDWSFDELVNALSWTVVQSLMSGTPLKDAMFTAVECSCRWAQHQLENKK
jgi:hypothetical protein